MRIAVYWCRKMSDINLQPWYTLMNSILLLIASETRRIMLIATLLSRQEKQANECLSIGEYVQITGLPINEVREHIETLCEADLLKPVKSKMYDITQFGRLTLSALGVTDDLVKQYATIAIIQK